VRKLQEKAKKSAKKFADFFAFSDYAQPFGFGIMTVRNA